MLSDHIYIRYISHATLIMGQVLRRQALERGVALLGFGAIGSSGLVLSDDVRVRYLQATPR